MDRSLLAVFARELKLARARAGLSQEQLAGKIAYSASLVAMVEGGRRVPSRDFSRLCDEVLGTGGALATLRSQVAGQQWAPVGTGTPASATIAPERPRAAGVARTAGPVQPISTGAPTSEPYSVQEPS